jgi:hypothetical protein
VGGACSTYGREQKGIKEFVRNPHRRERLVGRRRYIYDDNITMNLKYNGMSWTRLIWVNLRKSSKLLWTR